MALLCSRHSPDAATLPSSLAQSGTLRLQLEVYFAPHVLMLLLPALPPSRREGHYAVGKFAATAIMIPHNTATVPQIFVQHDAQCIYGFCNLSC